MAVFFEEDTRTLPITVCRGGEGSTFRFRGPRGFIFEMLASSKKGKLMEQNDLYGHCRRTGSAPAALAQ